MPVTFLPRLTVTRACLITVFLGMGHLPGPGVSVAVAAEAATAAALLDFSIAPGRLNEVLGQFGQQAGVMVGSAPALTQGVSSPGLQGRYSAADGLGRLLSGTGLEARQLEDGSFLLRAAPQASDTAVLDTVVVTGDDLSPKDEAYRKAGSSSYISRDDIERFRGTSVGDIFKGTPGVLVGENRNSGGLDINIRGMQGQGRVPVLIDGARQETTVYRGYSGVSSRSYVDPDLIGGIQIDKGVTMTAQSTGAIGGMVSMRTLEAADIVKDGETFGIRMRGSAIGNNSGSPVDPGTQSGYRSVGGLLGGVTEYRQDCASAWLCQGSDVAQLYPTDDTMDRPGTFTPKSYAGSIAIAKRFEKLDLVAAYAHREQGNYYAGKHGQTPWLDLSEKYNRGFYTQVVPKLEGASRFRGEELIVNSNYKSNSTLLKAKTWLPADQELELGFMRYDSSYGQLMPSQLIWFGNAEQTENSEVTVKTYTSRYRWNPLDNDLIDVRLNAWLTDTDTLNRNYSETIGQVSGGSLNGREKYKRRGVDLTNSMMFYRLGSIRLDYGASVQWEKIGSHALGDDQGANNGFFRDGKRTEYGLFTSLQWKPVDSLTLDAGLRYTRFRVQDDNAIEIDEESAFCVDADNDGRCDPVFYSNRKTGVTPSLSATWEFANGWQLYGLYAEAIRMPSLFESSSGFSVTPTLDADLKPEHAYNREFGLNIFQDGVLASNDHLRLKFAYFRNTVRNYLTRTISNTWEDTSTGQNSFWRMRNIDRATFNGLEVSGSYDLGFLFTDFGATRYTKIETCLTGSYRRYACTDYGIANSYINNMIPPKWHATATIGTRLFDQRLTMGVRGTFMGKRNPVPENNNQASSNIGLASTAPVEWHAYKVFDLFASYKVNDSLSVDFNIDNFTDRYYLDALSLGLVPAPGRTARLSATVSF